MTGDEWTATDRGFLVASTPYAPYQGDPVDALTVQESSLATENRLWVGPRNGERLHLNVETATWLRDRITEWLGDGVDPVQDMIDENQR